MNSEKDYFIDKIMQRFGLSRKQAQILWRLLEDPESRNTFLMSNFGIFPVSLTPGVIPFQPSGNPSTFPLEVLGFLIFALIILLLNLVGREDIVDWLTGGTSTAEPPPIGTLGLGTASGPYPSIGLDSLPENARTAYNRYRKQGWKGTLPGATPGTGAGGTFDNDGREGSAVLPKTDANGNPITYREFDVNNKEDGKRRDDERLVLGSDGKVYYTNDHYKTFVEVTPEAGTGNSGENNDNEDEANSGNGEDNGGNQTPPPNFAPA